MKIEISKRKQQAQSVLSEKGESDGDSISKRRKTMDVEVETMNKTFVIKNEDEDEDLARDKEYSKDQTN